MSSVRRLLKRATLVLVSFVVTFAGAEGIYRVVTASGDGGGGDDDWYQRYRTMNETIYMRSSVEGLVYEPRPSSAVEMEYGIAGFDAQRRRSDGTARPAPEGERVHVAMVGDSLVWSEFVSVADSLPAQTELALGTDEFRVSNFGVSGYDLREAALYYERRVRPHAPDIVVVVFCMNDLFIASGPFGRFGTEDELALKDEQDRMFDRVARVRRETLDGVAQTEEREASLKLLSRLRAIYRRATFDAHYVDEYTIAANDAARLERMAAALSRLGGAIRADGAAPVLLISPILESWDRYHWAAIHEAVEAAGLEAGFSVHDPLEDWRGAMDLVDLRSPGDNLHYSERGNRVFGGVVAEAVRAARE